MHRRSTLPAPAAEVHQMSHNPITRLKALSFGPLLLSLLALVSGAASAATATECTGVGICYCVNPDFKAAIAEKVTYFRGVIAEQHAKGKAVGYLSVPLSTVGGGYFNVNREVAEKMKQTIEARLGAASAWILNPTAKEADLPNVGGTRASQGDYLLMWTRILEGPNGQGEDFDFIYFAGPSDFAGFFGLTGSGDMDKIAAYFDERVKNDADLKRAVERGTLTATSFRNYYALRASVNFSIGAHDEWNVIRLANARRRDDSKFGVANQLPVFFDGHEVLSAETEQAVNGGNAGACKN
jgi:hypothetical protein